MKVAVVSRGKDLISKILKHYGLVKVVKDPEVVIAFGGDGTLLYSENKYPGVPKLFVYHHSSCKDCSKHDFRKILDALGKGEFIIMELIKLEVKVNGIKLYAMNDVNVHYFPPTALRFSLSVGLKDLGSFIGDGVVVATPYGSTGYYNSITQSKFSKGVGVAFNNCVSGRKSKVVNDESFVEIKIERGPGVLAVDSNAKLVKLKQGDIILIKKAKKNAKMIKLNNQELKIMNY